MLRNLGRLAVLSCLVVIGLVGTTEGQIGAPMGTFDITVRLDGAVIAQDTVTIGPGGELVDLQATSQDGDPEDFTQIGSLGPDGSPIILKVTAEGDPSFRLLHWYIDAPASLDDIYSPGPTSLFDPRGAMIDVTVTGLTFDNGAETIPFVVNNNTFATSFLRDGEGHFYESLFANPFDAYGNGILDIQVPGEIYLDSSLAYYNFIALQLGQTASWTWSNILNPGFGTLVNDGTQGGVGPEDPGYVFELGLAVAFVSVPEPGTVALLLTGIVPLAFRRGRRS